VLWLASAAESVNGSPFNLAGLGSGCGAFDNVRGTTAAARQALKEAKSLCQQQQALQAFGFLGWLARE
jgi:alpha/beta superfamily hydrolase